MSGTWGCPRLKPMLMAGFVTLAAASASATPYVDSQTHIFTSSRQLTIDFAVPTTISGPMTLGLRITGQFLQNAENATLSIVDPFGNIDFGTIADNDPNNDIFAGPDPNGISLLFSINLAENLIAPLILDGVLSFFATVSGAVAVTASPPRPIIQIDLAWEAPEVVAPVPAPAAGLLFATGLALLGLRRRR